MTIRAIVRDGKIVPVDDLSLADGTRLLVTFVPDDDESGFWQEVDQDALGTVWNNDQDDVYAQLLKE